MLIIACIALLHRLLGYLSKIAWASIAECPAAKAFKAAWHHWSHSSALPQNAKIPKLSSFCGGREIPKSIRKQGDHCGNDFGHNHPKANAIHTAAVQHRRLCYISLPLAGKGKSPSWLIQIPSRKGSCPASKPITSRSISPRNRSNSRIPQSQPRADWPRRATRSVYNSCRPCLPCPPHPRTVKAVLGGHEKRCGRELG